MKQLLFFLLLFTASGINLAQSPILEIHHIGGSDGDATLIMVVDSTGKNAFTGQQNWDTTVMLIDCQRYSGTGEVIWEYIRDTVGQRFPGRRRIDHIFISHLHIDHYGGLPRLLEKANTAGWTIGDVYDRQNVNYSDYFKATQVNGGCYDDFDKVDPDGTKFEDYNKALSTYHLTPTKTLRIGQNMLPNYKTAYMFCVVAYGLTNPVNQDYDTCFLPKTLINGKNYYTPKSENDLSTGFLIRFQGFNYLTLGDLGGVSGGNYVDGETPVTKGLLAGLRWPEDYHICANKVSHHGSAESSTKWFVTTNNFTASIIPASLRSYGQSDDALPTQTAITNLQTTGTNNLFYTFVPKNPGTPSSFWTKSNREYYNDVVIRFSQPPGYDNIEMTIIQRKKKSKGVYVGSATVTKVTCTKGHQW